MASIRLIAVVLLINMQICFSSKSITVSTRKGPIEGYIYEGAAVFEGVPYAKAPVNELRFKKPREMDSWHPEILETKRFRPFCPQSPSIFSRAMNIVGNMSEDCLYLNIYAPLNVVGNNLAKLPVMVWFHGGSFSHGSASQMTAKEIVANLVSRGVLVASFNYRLDILGFFTLKDSIAVDRKVNVTPAFTENLALFDQKMALKWLMKEVVNFGGSPKRITVFGHNTGAVSISVHLYNEAYSSLFAQAILQSGSPFSPFALTDPDNDTNSKLCKLVVERLSCNLDRQWERGDGDSILKCLRSFPVNILLETSTKLALKHGISWKISTTSCTRVGLHVEHDPAILCANRKLFERSRSNIPILIGTVKDEMLLNTAWNTAFMEGTTNLFRSNIENESFFESALDQMVSLYFYPENIRSYIRNLIRHHYLQTVRFDKDKSTDWLRMTVQMLSAHLFFAPAIKEAQLLAKHSKNVFMHSLDFVSDGFQWNDSAKGVSHGMDIFYLFAVSPENLGWRYSEKENQIINLMGTMWTNFAKSGDPNRPVPLKPYPRFYPLNKTSNWQYLSIDLPPRMEPFYKIDDAVLFNFLIPEQVNLIKKFSCSKNSGTFAENRSSSNFSVFSIVVCFCAFVTLIFVILLLWYRSRHSRRLLFS